MNPSNSTSTNVTTGIYYNVTGVTANDTRCDAGEDNVLTLEIGWNQTGTTMPSDLEKEITITLNYEQVA